MKYGKIKGYAPEDSTKWKCDWLNCDWGLGLAGRGICSANGTWGYKNCKKFEDVETKKIRTKEVEDER